MQVMMEQNEQIINEVIQSFRFPEGFKESEPYGNGHINTTYRLTFDTLSGTKRYILQKMNGNVFAKPAELMENLVGVTEWLKKKIVEAGGDSERETLNFICTKEDKPYYVDSNGEYWRACFFVEGTISFDLVERPEDFYESALAFGRFQRMLSDYPAQTLHESIKDFHNTVKRLGDFKKAVEEDICGRAAAVQEEIRFVLDREEFAHTLCDLEAQGKLPIRVTHNDTKLNNILIDSKTRKGLCVIDLDTVMPGLAVNDFGDSIRFGASTAEEDEQDLDRVSFDLELYELYTKGFIQGCGGALTDEELYHLPTGAIMMTLECGMRFLADHLEGDHYFKIHREGHNLDRCRTQFKLVKDMEDHLEEMREIVEKYR